MHPHYPEEYSKKHADSPVQPDRLLWSRGEGPICRDEHSCSAGFSSKHSKYWTVQLSMLLVFGLMTFFFFFFLKMRNMHSPMGSTGDPFTTSGGPAPPVLLHLMKLEGKLFKKGKLSIFIQKPKQWGSKIICNNTDKNRTWVPTDAKSLYSSKDPSKRAMLLLPHLWNGERWVGSSGVPRGGPD